jgi:hypothetical protein
MAGKTLGVAESEPVLDAITVNGSATITGTTSLGSTASTLVGFHGSTADQAAFIATIGTTVLQGSVSASAIVGFSAGKFSLLLALVNGMQAALIEKGLMASS